LHLFSGFRLFHFTNRQNKNFYKCDSDEYFDGGNFQGFQSERAFSAHELIAGCPAPPIWLSALSRANYRNFIRY